MGIPGFYGQWLSKNVKRAIIKGIPQNISSLSIDLNGTFHEARRRVFNDDAKDKKTLDMLANKGYDAIVEEIFYTVTDIISEAVRSIRPHDMLILAVDGVAPGAKLQQQKGRREKAARTKSPLDMFDRNAFTPGTNLMMDLDRYITSYIREERNELPRRVIYSSHLVPGEGEHKIMRYLRKMGRQKDSGDKHVVYGLDADLIMLSLLLPLKNVYLSRETVDSSVDINAVRDHLRSIRGERTIKDFVIMTMLLGNDFLPRSPSLQEMGKSIELLIDTYSRGDYWLHGIDDKDREVLNFADISLMLSSIASEENRMLADLVNVNVKYPSRFIQSSTVNNKFYPESFREMWYNNASDDRNISIPESLVPTSKRFDGNSIDRLCFDYMITMSWVYCYYTEGTDFINQDWIYHHYQAPLLSDLAESMARDRPLIGYRKYNGMMTFTVLHQLLAVLPIKSNDLVPEELLPLMSIDSPIRDIYPDDFVIEMDGASYDHEGIPIIPFIDRRRIYDAVRTVKFSRERMALFREAAEITFDSDHIPTYEYDKPHKSNHKSSRGPMRVNNRGGRGNKYSMNREQK